MTAFDDAFYLLKNEHFFDLAYDSLLLKGKFEDAHQMQGMRQFVLENENSGDPAKRQAAEEMYEHLTRLMSHTSNPMAAEQSPQMPQIAGHNAPMPEGPRPVGEGGAMSSMNEPAPPPQHPMMKAWASLKQIAFCPNTQWDK